MNQHTQIVCTSCGTVAHPKKVTPGNLLTELALWFFPIVAGVLFWPLFLLLVPVLAYSIWRMSACHLACTACGQTTIIPVASPSGQKFLGRA